MKKIITIFLLCLCVVPRVLWAYFNIDSNNLANPAPVDSTYVYVDYGVVLDAAKIGALGAFNNGVQEEECLPKCDGEEVGTNKFADLKECKSNLKQEDYKNTDFIQECKKECTQTAECTAEWKYVPVDCVAGYGVSEKNKVACEQKNVTNPETCEDDCKGNEDCSLCCEFMQNDANVFWNATIGCECDGNDLELDKGKCVGPCATSPENAKTAHRQWNATSKSEECVIDECNDGYKISDDGKSCVLYEDVSQEQSTVQPQDDACTDGKNERNKGCPVVFSAEFSQYAGFSYYAGAKNCYRICEKGKWVYFIQSCKDGYMVSWDDGGGKYCNACENQVSNSITQDEDTCWDVIKKEFSLDEMDPGCDTPYCNVQKMLSQHKDDIERIISKCSLEQKIICNIKDVEGVSVDVPYYLRQWNSYDDNSEFGWDYKFSLKATGCKEGYHLDGKKCVLDEDVSQEQSTVQPQVDACTPEVLNGLNAVEGKVNGQGMCEATKCNPGYYFVYEENVYQGWCVGNGYCKNGEKLNIIDGDKTDLQCIKQSEDESVAPQEQEVLQEADVVDVPEGVAPQNQDGNSCESGDKNAKSAKWQDGKCVIDSCNDGYELKSGKCVEISGPCATLPENAKTAHRQWDATSKSVVCIIDECVELYKISDDGKSCVVDKKAKSKKKIDELEKNAQAMKDKEQSTANKMLGGATMAATGLGAMQAMSAYSEQQSDEDAERAMKAYLATFHCNYAPGKNIQGGEMNVQLPGGNELVNLYAEYVNLANNLKVRKAALEMRPGIESESILDSAMTGLYDDVTIGKTTGAFTSLARALQNPDGEDAKAWAAQKDNSKSNMETGLKVAGIGAVAGVAGNLLINHDSAKENSKEILAKYKDDGAVEKSDGTDKKSTEPEAGTEKLVGALKKADVAGVAAGVAAAKKEQNVKEQDKAATQVKTPNDMVVVKTANPDNPNQEKRYSVPVADDISKSADGTVMDGDKIRRIKNITNAGEVLDKLATQFNKQPSSAVKKAWDKFAQQCSTYNGVLSIEKSVGGEGYRRYDVLCYFPDLDQTEETVRAAYNTIEGKIYFTTDNISESIRIANREPFKSTKYRKKYEDFQKRLVDMGATWSIRLMWTQIDKDTEISSDGNYSAMIRITDQMALEMVKSTNGRSESCNVQ